MPRVIVVIIVILVVFFVTWVVFKTTRKKQKNKESEPLIETMNKYQNQILKNSYDISFTSEPTNKKNNEKMLYQTLGKISNVDFDVKNPESKQITCNVWLSENTLYVNSDKENIMFDLKEIKEFEFELAENGNDILFAINDEYIKISTKDLYFVSLFDLLIRKYSISK